MPDEAEVTPLLQEVVAELVARYGSDVDVLRSPGAPGADRAKLCDLSLAFNEAILERPLPEASAMFRRLLAWARP